MSGVPVPARTAHRIVEVATRAPSIHNTQPWRWRATAHTLELHADRTRQLAASDPTGRTLVISCGTALHHARLAADALGWSAAVTRLPDPDRPDLLARLRLAPTTPATGASEVIGVIDERRTDRRRFTSWPVPDERLDHLAAVAQAQGTRAVPVVDVIRRFRANRIVARAQERQSRDVAVVEEHRSWVEHSHDDGVPLAVLPTERPAISRTGGGSTRFPPGVAEDHGRDIEGSDGLIVLCAPDDTPMSWLAAGEGLSALWLAATEEGLSVVPLSQVIEVEATRRDIAEQLLGGFGQPLILVRIGWQAISRSDIPPTPRRPVEDVLEFR